MKRIDPILQERLMTLISSMRYELLGCELLPAGRQTIFRIYIDRPQGISADDCALVSRQISAMLDVEDPIQGKYTLEVSSPGIDRPLFEIAHYKKYIGNRVKIRLHAAINNRRQIKGVLKRVDDEAVYVWIGSSDQELKLPFAMIEKANLIGDVHF